MSELHVNAAGSLHRLSLTPEDASQDLASLLAARGYPLDTRCGGQGWCHGCEVELEEGRLAGPEGDVEAASLVRACQMHVTESGAPPRIRIPDRAHLALSPKVEDSFALDPRFILSPPFEVLPAIRDTGFAVDIGTTTVAVMLADLSTGYGLSRAGAFNAQIRFGDNVLTRIGAASDPAVREAMRRAILDETISPLLLRACERAGRPLSRLAGGSIAGNTTMLHLLLGEDPSGMGVAPFTARFLESRCITAGSLGLKAQDASGILEASLKVQLLPGISAYVGADLCAGMLATDMMAEEGAVMLVDIGTNGEIVLHSGGRLYATATAAGPAFEGAGLMSGTRAHHGAISHVTITEDLGFELKSIGEPSAARALGLCGTAYVDFLAEGRRCGLLKSNGRMNPVVHSLLPARHRAGCGDSGHVLRIAGDVCISEEDIAHLLHAKAAIAAGIETLLLHAGIEAKSITRLFVAGGFGMYLDMANTLAIGMLPGFRIEQCRAVGNSSLAGALIACLDGSALAKMEAFRGRTEVVELNLHASFEDRFIDHLSLP